MLATVASILGMVLGTAGFVISILNYLRDRPRVQVQLAWDIKHPELKELFGSIYVTNTGRRPAFITNVAIEVPPGYPDRYLRLDATREGKRIGEGDPPMVCGMKYEQLKPYAAVWKQLRACATDTTGRMYYAKKQSKGAKTPSWVLDTSISKASN